ncbi:MAG: hypothetical protein KGH98_00900 [Candidatus Micrarchaeota archaeon]|nr:hypothetical protein [Candidatus Micrarchaeota archaeon]
MYILGVWDGHDSGAALINENEIVYAANEERFTKRKLEIDFPYHSIAAALKYAGIKPSDVGHVAFTTTEFTKTLERVFPYMKESYYMFRRRKMLKPRLEGFRHHLKYNMTRIGVLPLCNQISSASVSGHLAHMGFSNYRLHVVDHHTAHAATAAFTAPFRKSLVVTVDGLGDGLSGSVSTFDGKEMERRVAVPATHSLGIFYEQVTNILGFRELEDEGKVMAMADYSYPFDYEKENLLRDFFKVEGTTIQARYSPSAQYTMLQRIAWMMPREQFAYMAQQVVENMLGKFTSNSIDRFNIKDVAFAGGIFSNIKANKVIRELEALGHWYVFPHMGDGGIALGAALYTSYLLNGARSYNYSAYLGDEFSHEETEKVLSSDRSLAHRAESPQELASHAAELISSGNYIFWFNGRMEYGPRALGDRSILAPIDSEDVKERLNIRVKKREWFQPFAPSMLEEEAHHILEYDSRGPDRYMTMAYMVRPEFRARTKAVTHIDGSARAQMVGEDENRQYRELLKGMKKHSGLGIVLNTSFNIHGQPIVRSVEDAIDTMKRTKTKYMFINGFFVTNRAAGV